MVLGVEEVRAEHVRAEHLRRADRDRLDLGGALERQPIVAGAERGVHVVERSAERPGAGVEHPEGKGRVDGIGVVGAREGLGCGGQLKCPLLVEDRGFIPRWYYTTE